MKNLLSIVIGLLICQSQAFADEAPLTRKIHLIWMGGNDCPPCVEWRKTQLPLLQANPLFQQIQFSYVTKSINSPVPARFFLPDEVKPYKEILDEASQNNGGSPQFAWIVDGQLYDYQFGTKPASTLIEMIRHMNSGQGKAPYIRCLQRKPRSIRLCGTPA